MEIDSIWNIAFYILCDFVDFAKTERPFGFLARPPKPEPPAHDGLEKTNAGSVPGDTAIGGNCRLLAQPGNCRRIGRADLGDRAEYVPSVLTSRPARPTVLTR